MFDRRTRIGKSECAKGFFPVCGGNPGLFRKMITSTHVNLFELEVIKMKVLKISRGQLFAYGSVVYYYAGCCLGAI